MKGHRRDLVDHDVREGVEPHRVEAGLDFSDEPVKGLGLELELREGSLGGKCGA